MDLIANVKALIYFLLQNGCGVCQNLKLTEVQVWALDFQQNFYTFSSFQTTLLKLSAVNWHLKEDHVSGKLAPKRRPFRWQIGTNTKAISVANWHPNEDHFDGDLALKKRPFWWWTFGTLFSSFRPWFQDRMVPGYVLVKTISTAILHSKDHFGAWLCSRIGRNYKTELVPN